jgi:hypothetical protein
MAEAQNDVQLNDADSRKRSSALELGPRKKA